MLCDVARLKFVPMLALHFVAKFPAFAATLAADFRDVVENQDFSSREHIQSTQARASTGHFSKGYLTPVLGDNLASFLTAFGDLR
jgi:hypothetical protein